MANTANSHCEFFADASVFVMDPLELTHWTLVQKRTQIRHDKLIRRWLQRCWQAAAGPQVASMNRDAYARVYRKLLAAMTIPWDDDIFRTVVDEMWHHDARAFAELDVDRFSCSVFAFAEMWVEVLDVAEYARVLELIHRISSTASEEHAIRRSNPTSLAAFFDALRQEHLLEARGLSIGKSPLFDSEGYAQAFGGTVPEVVAGTVASMNHKPIVRRHSGTHLPSSAARADAKVVAHLRPRSCSVMVRTSDATSSATSNFNVTSRKLVIYRPGTTKESAYRIKS